PGAELLHLWGAHWRAVGVLLVLRSAVAGVQRRVSVLGGAAGVGGRDVGAWRDSVHGADADLVWVEASGERGADCEPWGCGLHGGADRVVLWADCELH